VASGLSYIRVFATSARQLNSLQAGLAFFRLGLPIHQAIAWANAGYTPEEVALLRELGLQTLDDVRQFEDDEIFVALIGKRD
jgi:hypothetical protein